MAGVACRPGSSPLHLRPSFHRRIRERASALGLYYTATGLASFAASTAGGLLWSAVGPWATFAFGAAAALAAAALMLLGRGKVRRALSA